MNRDNLIVEVENETMDSLSQEDGLSSSDEHVDMRQVKRQVSVNDKNNRKHHSQPMTNNEKRSIPSHKVSVDDVRDDPSHFKKRHVSAASDSKTMGAYGRSQLDRLHSTNSHNKNDVMSTDSVDGRMTNTMSTKPHKMSVAASLRSLDHISPPATKPEDKSKTFSRTLATVGGYMYGMLIITLGTIIFIGDIFVDTVLAEAYCLYLIIVGFIYLGFLMTDIRIHISKSKKYHQQKIEYEMALDEMMTENEGGIADGPYTIEGGDKAVVKIPNPILRRLPPEPPRHLYCFSEGRHAGSFYLKLGAAAFCLGLLIQSLLFFNMQIVYLSSDLGLDCGNVAILIFDILYPIYSFLQLFLIFKYSNVIILKCRSLGRFALIHVITSSLCFWIWTIVREVMDALIIYAKKSSKKLDEYNSLVEPEWIKARPMGIPIISYGVYGIDYVRNIFNLTNLAENNCTTAHGFDGLVTGVFPYLYPFTIEYSILIIGIFYIIWSNIGHCAKGGDAAIHTTHAQKDWDSDKSSESEHCNVGTPVDENGLVSNLHINIDCHSSNKGWFGGLIVLVLSIVSVIVTYVTVSSEENANIGVIVKDGTEILMDFAMLVVAVLAYVQIKKLDVNLHPISMLDDLLLFICLPAFFFDGICSFVPAVIYSNWLKIVNICVTITQVLIQTPMIIDALRRCSNTRDLRRRKPGRELITFLLVCNVAAWIFETFSIKNADVEDERYDFYGKALWTILGHISIPLCVFYRFHSSVCLADIWKAAYEPGNGH